MGRKIISPRFVLDLDKASEGEKEGLRKSLLTILSFLK